MRTGVSAQIVSLLFGLALVGAPDPAPGQALVTLTTPPDPRSEAMGRFPSGLTSGPFAAWGTVAGLGYSPGIQLSASRHEVYPDLIDGTVHSYGSLSVSRPLGSGLRLGLGVCIADLRFPVSRELLPSDCEPVGNKGPHERTYGLSAALCSRKTIALGASVKWLKGQFLQPCRGFDPSRPYRSRPIYDVGLQSRLAWGSREAGDHDLVLIGGLTAVNLGGGIDAFEISGGPPARAARAAVGTEVRHGSAADIGFQSGSGLLGHAPLITLALSFGAERPLSRKLSNSVSDSLATVSFWTRNRLSAGGGVEVAFLRTLFARAGYFHDDPRAIDGWTWGLGIGLAGMAGLDFARVPQFAELASLHKVSLWVRWPRI